MPLTPEPLTVIGSAGTVTLAANSRVAPESTVTLAVPPPLPNASSASISRMPPEMMVEPPYVLLRWKSVVALLALLTVRS